MAENTKITCVIDSSFALSYLLPDEHNALVQTLFDEYKRGKIDLIAVSLLPFEVVNGIYAATLSKRFSPIIAQKLISEFLDLPIILEAINYDEVFKLSNEYKISVYDSSYLLLSRMKNLKLLTLDKKLQKLIKNN